MFQRRLKTNIVIIIATLLFLAMLSIDFVMIITSQKDMLRSEISKGYLVLAAIESNLTDSSYSESNNLYFENKDSFDRMLSKTAVSCVLVVDGNNKKIFSSGKNCALKDKIERITRQAMQSGKKKNQYDGTTWGVFWKKRRHVIISEPFFKAGRVIGGAGIALPLEGIYKALRRTQSILLIYILINIIVLTIIGLYRVSKVTVMPLQRLAKRAEEYKEEDGMFFSARKEDNELNKLSKALNRMLTRISEDKEKLQATVLSLEKANIDLKQAQRDIIRAEKLASVGRLSSGIAHEIGNPIGIVIGYLDLLKQKDIEKKEKKEFITRAENEINRINDIIRQLLDFSRPTQEDLKPVSVHKIIEETTSIVRIQPFMSNIDLTLSLSADRDTVMADPNQLQQVFLNLLMNAADAIYSGENKPGGELIISSEIVPDIYSNSKGHQDVLKISYMDTGSGISEGSLDNIFDPFYTTKEPGKGTGLGLYVCFMIMEGIGGKIEASSKENVGTTITITLPLYEMSVRK